MMPEIKIGEIKKKKIYIYINSNSIIINTIIYV